MKTTTFLIGLVAAILATSVHADRITIDQGNILWLVATSACKDTYESCNASCRSLAEQCSGNANKNYVKACQAKVQACRKKCATYLERCSSSN
ncbi:MAG: hypothetical protein WD823_08815 [Sulfuricaulis sp.]|uniref:hypothetical protein n=1 Tax=Sulfuricaulis sp. TaxID=2003553 RepID=UPI0034A4089F